MAAPWFRDRPRPPLGQRLAGDLVLWILLAALTHVAVPDLLYQGRVPAGGSVGLFFGEILRALFSTLGSFLVGGTAVALLFIARSAFSFIEWCERISELARRFQRWGLALWSRLAQSWREASRLRRQEEAPLVGLLARPVPNALQDGQGSWAPREQTGAPPPAISAALRRGLGLEGRAPLGADQAADDAADPDSAAPAAEPEEPSASAGRVRAPRSSRAKRESESVEPPAPPSPAPIAAPKATAGPTIVDTRPHSRLLRAAPPNPDNSQGSYVAPSPDLLHPTPVEASPSIGSACSSWRSASRPRSPTTA
jgi:S-DNA-T family DNA segregation ATPase FtsK/SpoIIIE